MDVSDFLFSKFFTYSFSEQLGIFSNVIVKCLTSSQTRCCTTLWKCQR